MAEIEESTRLGWPELLPTEHLTAEADQDGASARTALGWPTGDQAASLQLADQDSADLGAQSAPPHGMDVLAGVSMPDGSAAGTTYVSRETALMDTGSSDVRDVPSGGGPVVPDTRGTGHASSAAVDHPASMADDISRGTPPADARSTRANVAASGRRSPRPSAVTELIPSEEANRPEAIAILVPPEAPTAPDHPADDSAAARATGADDGAPGGSAVSPTDDLPTAASAPTNVSAEVPSAAGIAAPEQSGTSAAASADIVEGRIAGEDGDQSPESTTRPSNVSRGTLVDPVISTGARGTIGQQGHRGAVSDRPDEDVSRGTESATDSSDASGLASQTPIADEMRAEARRRRALTGRQMAAPHRTRVLTVSNQKGGVGKTTTVVNLAAAMALSGLNVLVLDIDPQGNASTALGVDHHADVQGVYDVLVEGAALDSVVVACPNISRLWCAPATIDLAGAEIELVSLVAREMRLKRAVDAYLDSRMHDGHDRIDYVLIDCPPSLGLLTVNALVAGQEVLIPIQCEYYALEGLSQLMKNIEMIRSHLNPTLEVSTILMTMYDGRTRLSAQVADDVREHFPEQVLKSTVPRSVRISEAPSHGQTVMTYDPSSSGALSYLEAAFEMAARGG